MQKLGGSMWLERRFMTACNCNYESQCWDAKSQSEQTEWLHGTSPPALGVYVRCGLLWRFCRKFWLCYSGAVDYNPIATAGLPTWTRPNSFFVHVCGRQEVGGLIRGKLWSKYIVWNSEGINENNRLNKISLQQCKVKCFTCVVDTYVLLARTHYF